MCVSTSTPGPSSAAIASSSPSASLVGGAQRKLSVYLEVERHRQLVPEFMDRDMVHRERTIARNHHDTIEYGLVIERDRVGGNHRLGARYLFADRSGDVIFECAHPIEWQRTADRYAEVDERLLANSTRAHLCDPDHSRYARRNSGDFFRCSGRCSVGKGIDRAFA